MDVAKLSDETLIFCEDVAVFVVEDKVISSECFSNTCS
jgi:hypothetical protein